MIELTKYFFIEIRNEKSNYFVEFLDVKKKQSQGYPIQYMEV